LTVISRGRILFGRDPRRQVGIHWIERELGWRRCARTCRATGAYANGPVLHDGCCGGSGGEQFSIAHRPAGRVEKRTGLKRVA